VRRPEVRRVLSGTRRGSVEHAALGEQSATLRGIEIPPFSRLQCKMASQVKYKSSGQGPAEVASPKRRTARFGLLSTAYAQLMHIPHWLPLSDADATHRSPTASPLDWQQGAPAGRSSYTMWAVLGHKTTNRMHRFHATRTARPSANRRKSAIGSAFFMPSVFGHVKKELHAVTRKGKLPHGPSQEQHNHAPCPGSQRHAWLTVSRLLILSLRSVHPVWM